MLLPEQIILRRVLDRVSRVPVVVSELNVFLGVSGSAGRS